MQVYPVSSGNVPDDEYYDNIYGEGRWAFSTIYSISIGEGELLVNPLHIANLGAIIANKATIDTCDAIRVIIVDAKVAITVTKLKLLFQKCDA